MRAARFILRRGEYSCVRQLPFRPRQGGYHRAGPLSRARAVLRAVFLGARRRAVPAFAGQHIPRDRERSGQAVSLFGPIGRWADQGVLLINAILTVRAHQTGSHRGRGWERFTDAVIRELNERKEHLVFMLWGAYAQKKGAFIDRSRHCVLTAPHPSPLSADRGFFGCRHFSRANAYLRDHGIAEIDW